MFFKKKPTNAAVEIVQRQRISDLIANKEIGKHRHVFGSHDGVIPRKHLRSPTGKLGHRGHTIILSQARPWSARTASHHSRTGRAHAGQGRVPTQSRQTSTQAPATRQATTTATALSRISPLSRPTTVGHGAFPDSTFRISTQNAGTQPWQNCVS